jgi:hypothetical protein
MTGESGAMKATAALALLLSIAAAAPAAAAERNFGVSGFDRVRVDGPYRVRLTTGVAPFARASGAAAGLDRVVVEVQGRTLIVRPDRSSWGGYPGSSAGSVEISVGTHELSMAWLNGAGSLEIDRVKGLSFDLSVQGAGSASIADVAVDQFEIALAGSGGASLAGSALKVTTVVRGIATLDAAGLTVKDATIGADGPATVRMTVTGTAKVDARGTGSVELTGNPSCTVRAAGSATVSGCR